MATRSPPPVPLATYSAELFCAPRSSVGEAVAVGVSVAEGAGTSVSVVVGVGEAVTLGVAVLVDRTP